MATRTHNVQHLLNQNRELRRKNRIYKKQLSELHKKLELAKLKTSVFYVDSKKELPL